MKFSIREFFSCSLIAISFSQSVMTLLFPKLKNKGNLLNRPSQRNCPKAKQSDKREVWLRSNGVFEGSKDCKWGGKRNSCCPQVNWENASLKTVVIVIFSNWVYMNKSNCSVGTPVQLDDGPSC